MDLAESPVVAALTGLPLTIALIVVGAVVVIAALRVLVTRAVRRIERSIPDSVRVGRTKQAQLSPRRRQRLETFRSVLNSTIGIVVGTVALLMILTALGVDVRPLLASAGVVGVAVAFGAQSLVRDVISGMFLLVEDQFGVGDRVEVGTGTAAMATGTVEEVALRVTTIRDDDGRLWYVRNGEILRVGNFSQGWSYAVVEVRLAPGTDLGRAQEVFSAVTTAMRSEEAFSSSISTLEPEWTVLDLTAEGTAVRWRVRTQQGTEELVASGLRRRVAEALATTDGIALAP